MGPGRLRVVTPRRGGVLLVAIVAMIIAVVLAFLAPNPGRVAARSAGDRLTEKIAALAEGDEVDLAQALGQPWERAVLMEAYMSGDEMNEEIGFQWYGRDDLSGSDESQRTLAFVSQKTVRAEVLLSPETFRLEESIVAFDRADGTFVASRDASGLVTLHRP
jgi:hypothetical protein